MHQRWVIKINWVLGNVAEAKGEIYAHPECVVDGLLRDALRALQTSEPVDISNDFQEQYIQAISPLDVHPDDMCSHCGFVLSQAPAQERKQSHGNE